MFTASVAVQLGDGTSADTWLPAGSISTFAANLFKAIGRKRRSRAVKDALSNRRWVRDITGAHTAPVLCEYVDLWEKLENIQLRPMESDRFAWRWTPDGKYSASSA